MTKRPDRLSRASRRWMPTMERAITALRAADFTIADIALVIGFSQVVVRQFVKRIPGGDPAPSLRLPNE